MKNNKIYLVNAGNDPYFAAITNDGAFPALSVLALGTWLRHTVVEADIFVRDGQVIPLESILDEIKRERPCVVGISVLATSYKNSLKIAKCAKAYGAYTIFGNDQAAQLSNEILKNQDDVDFVICSEYGEKSLELLIKNIFYGKPALAAIHGLAYRDGKKIVAFDYDKNKKSLSIVNSPVYFVKDRKTALDIFPVVDRTLYPQSHWTAYKKNYLSKYAGIHSDEITGVTTMNRARGCSRANENIKCTFCDMLLDISFSSPEYFWHEVKSAYEQVRANVFYEVCDSFTSFPNFIKSILCCRPSDLAFTPHFFVYGQALDLTRNKDLPQMLSELGVFRVNIGLESGSNKTLKYLKGKYDSVKSNYEALLALKKYNINAYGSFVLGCDAETKATLRETINWIKKIISEDLLIDVSVQPLIPLPRNIYGKKLVKNGLLQISEENSDTPWNIDGIAETYINTFSGVSYQDVVDACSEIRNWANEHAIYCGTGISLEEYDQL